jgi:hypothetical protein
MQRFIGAVRMSLAEKNWFSALAMSLTLPDICARIEGLQGKSEARYIQWFDRNLLDVNSADLPGLGRTVFLSGGDCYALRCAYLHEGTDEVGAHHRARRALSKYHFRAPGGLGLHRNLFNGILQLRIDLFCEEICVAVELWDKSLERTPDIQERFDALLEVHENADGYNEIMVRVGTEEEAERHRLEHARRFQ